MAVSWKDLLTEAAAGGGSFEPLPDGDYPVVIEKATPAQSSGGKLMFKVEMRVESGPHAKRIIWNQFVISPESANALSMFFGQMKTLGLGEEFWAAEPNEDIVASALVGRRCTVALTQREWNGQIRNNVKSVKPAAGGVPDAPVAVPSAAPPASAAAPASPF